MNVSIQLILCPSAVCIFRNKYVSGKQSAPAPAADASTAAIGSRDSGTFQSNKDVLICIARDIKYLVAHFDFQIEDLVFCFHRISGIVPWLTDVIIKLLPVILFDQSKFFSLSVQELVHSL